MCNVIKIDFNQTKQSAYINMLTPRQKLFVSSIEGTLARKTIQDYRYTQYKFAKQDMKESLNDIKYYYNQMIQPLTSKQYAKIVGNSSYFDIARKISKISKKSSVLHYAHLILCEEVRFERLSIEYNKKREAFK